MDQAQLKTKLHYDPETGAFTNLRLGRQVGTYRDSRDGYCRLRVFGPMRLCQRLAWLYVYGVWPTSVDHINGVRHDNRIANLREATKSQNGMNRKAQANNTSGAKGVYWDRGKWCASICLNRKRIYLGRFATIEEASAAYETKAAELHGEYARSG